MRDFHTLTVWKKAHILHLAVYQASREFPRDELFGLTAQIRNAARSVPTNIAEGCGRGSDPELGRFLQIAMGSASEVEYLLLSSRDLGFLSQEDWDDLTGQAQEVKRMLTAFIKRIRGGGEPGRSADR
jgi:four helix bundle protein